MPHLTDIQEQIDLLVEEALKDMDFFRVESTVKGTVQSPIINVYVDGDNGITIGNCARISRDMHRRIEEVALCPDGFELNVSSPGLERSLRLLRQYARHVGRDVHLEIDDSGADATIEGRLVGAAGDEVRVEDASGEKVLRFGSIRKAVVKAPW